MRIFHIGIFQDHELGGDIIFSKGFEKLGHIVNKYDYRNKFKYVECFEKDILNSYNSEDLVFIGKGELLSPNILSLLKKKNAKIALWYGDIRQNPPIWLQDIGKYIDVFFMSSGGDTLAKYHSILNPKKSAFYVNPSDPELVTIKTKQLSVEKNLNILFTGTSYLFGERIRYDTIKYISRRKDARISGGGQLVNYLSGNKYFDRIIKRINRRNSIIIRGDDYIRAILSTKIGIGVNAFNNIEKYTSDRIMHYTSFGTTFLTYNFKGLDKLFIPGEEVESYSSVDELDSKINILLKNPSLLLSIGKAGQLKTINMYNNTIICDYMLDVLFDRTSILPPWAEIIF